MNTILLALCTGSCCVSMVYVASGECSSYFENNIGGIWDVAAGCIIVKEAGGIICNLDGSLYDTLKTGVQQILCGNEKICHVIAETLAICRQMGPEKQFK